MGINDLIKRELEEKIESLNEVIDSIIELQDKVDQIVEGTGIENNYFAYGRYGFDDLLGNGNPYNSSLYSIQKKLKELKDELR